MLGINTAMAILFDADPGQLLAPALTEDMLYEKADEWWSSIHNDNAIIVATGEYRWWVWDVTTNPYSDADTEPWVYLVALDDDTPKATEYAPISEVMALDVEVQS